MEFGTMVKSINYEIDREFAEKGVMTLGELVATLCPYNKELPVKFDDGSIPGDFDSYRGYYRYIAIGRGSTSMVGDLLEKATSAIGQTYEGYKGGEFTMHKNTPVFISEWGSSSGVGVVGVEFVNGVVTLKTRDVENDE